MIFGVLAGSVLALLVVYLAFGGQSRPAALSLALASASLFIYSDPVDSWINNVIYPYLGRALVDCFIVAVYILLGSQYMSVRGRRVATTVCFVLCVLAIAIFLSVPTGDLVDGIATHMLDNVKFATYASAINLATVVASMAILLGPRDQLEGRSATTVRIVVKAAASLALGYVAVRTLTAFSLAPTAAAVVVSNAMALLLGVGLALVVVCNALAIRRATERRIAELQILARFLDNGSDIPRPPRRTAWTSTARLVDLIASTSDQIATLQADHPIRVATMTSPERGGGHNVGVASESLFILARAVIAGEFSKEPSP